MVLASLLMLGGSTADRLGRARVFKFGLALFTAASLACSLAPGIGWLIAFRVVQGVAGAMLNPVAMSIIRNTFEDPRERAQAIGIWGAVVGISMALGPVLGGVLVELSWRAVFLVNIPIGLAAIALTARFVPESRAPRPRRPDPVGQVLVIVMLASLTSAIIEGPSLGWGSPWIVALAVTAGVVARGARALRAAPRRPADRAALLRQPAVRRGDGHRGRGVHGVRRVPVPQHALPAGRARPLAGERRPVHAADGGHDRAGAARSPAASSARAGCAGRWSSAASGWAWAA